MIDTASLIKEIRQFHDLYDLPVTGQVAEKIFTRFAQSNRPKKEMDWKAGSHQPGTDVRFADKGFSVKSGKFQGSFLPISSYRTTLGKTLADKIAIIRQIEKTIDAYIVFARKESKGQLRYHVYMIDPPLLAIDSFVIRSVKANYVGTNEHGVKLEIRETMSGQCWFYVPRLALESKMVHTVLEYTLDPKAS